MAGVDQGEMTVGDVVVLAILAVIALTMSVFWLVKRWSAASRRRFLIRSSIGLGAMLMVISGFSLAGITSTNALFSAVGSFTSTSVVAAYQFTPQGVQAIAPSPGKARITWAPPMDAQGQPAAWVRGYNIYRRGEGVAALASGVVKVLGVDAFAVCSGGTTDLCLANNAGALASGDVQFDDPDTALSQLGIYYYVVRALRYDELSATIVEVPANSVEVAVLPDPSTPGLLVTWPPPNATGIPTNTTLAIQFDRPMRPTTVEPAYTLRNCLDGRGCTNPGTPVPLTFQWTAQNTLMLVSPGQLLMPGGWYRVGLSNGATDLGGNVVTGSSWVFQIGTTVDATVPQVLGWDPPSGAKDVRLDQPVTLLFSKAMNMTATNPAVSICQVGGACVTGLTHRWDSSATLLEVGHPGVAFVPGQSYRVWVSTTARDAAGNQVPLPRWAMPDCPPGVSDCGFATTFAVPATASDADAAAPVYLASVSPDAGAVNVPPNTTITLQFSKSVQKATLPTAISVCPPAGACTSDLSFGWDTTGRIVTIYFKDELLPNTQYSVIVTTRVTDLTGVPIARAVTWSFMTDAVHDATPPRLTSVFPADSQMGVSLSATMALTFSEPVQVVTVRGGLSVCELNDPTRCISRLELTGENGNRTVLVAHPMESFRNATQYRIRLTTAVRDLAGNVLVSGSGACPAGDDLCAYAATFATIGTSDTVPPTLTTSAPLDGSGVSSPAPAVTVPLSYTFSEPMDRATVERSVTVTCVPVGCVVPVLTPLWSTANTQLTMTHTVPFTGAGTYVVTISGDARDVAGNSLLGVCAPRASLAEGAQATPCTTEAFRHAFTVAAVAQATPAPVVLAPTVPAPNEIGVAPESTFVVVFSRPVAQSTAQGAFRISCAPAGCATPTTFRYAWNAAGTVVTATPATPWTPGATYVVTVGSTVIDLNGTAIAPDAVACAGEAGCAYRWQFTVQTSGVAAAPLAPVVTLPGAPQWTGASAATIAGCVPGPTTVAPAAGTCAGIPGSVTVEVWRDVNADGTVSPGVDTIVAAQPLTAGIVSFSFTVPLEPTVENRFVARVQDARGVFGPVVAVPSIWQADVTTTAGALSVLPGPGTLTIAIPFTGDMEKPAGFAPPNQKNAAIAEWGDTAVSPTGTFATCQAGNSGRCPMVRTATGFSLLVTGLTLSSPYPVRVTVTDVDGTSGTPVQTAQATITGSATGGLLASASAWPLAIASRAGQGATFTTRTGASAQTVQVRITGGAGLIVQSPCIASAGTGTDATWIWNGRDAQDAYVPDGAYLAQVTAFGASGCSGAFQTQILSATVANASSVVLSPDPYTVTVSPGESTVISATVTSSQGSPVVSGNGAVVTWRASGSITGDVSAWLSRASSEIGLSNQDCTVMEGSGQACVRIAVPAATTAAQTIRVSATVASQTGAGAARSVTSSTSINDPPGAPASLQLSAGSIIFRWKAASDPRVAGYKIYVGTLPGIYDTVLDAGKETTYHWEDTQINQVYYAVVKSYDSLGLLSAPTNEARMVAKTGRGVGTPPAALATATAYCAAQATSVAGNATPGVTAIAVSTAVPALPTRAGTVIGATPTTMASGAGGAPTGIASTATPLPTVAVSSAAVVAANATPISCVSPMTQGVASTPRPIIAASRTPAPTATPGIGTPSVTPEPIGSTATPEATATANLPPTSTPLPTGTPVPGPPASVSLMPPPLASTLLPGESLVLRALVTDERGAMVADGSRTVVRWSASLAGGIEVGSWLGSVETLVGGQTSGRYGSCSVPAMSGQSCTILLVPKEAVMNATLTIVAEATGGGTAAVAVGTSSVRTAVGSTQIIISPPRGVKANPTSTATVSTPTSGAGNVVAVFSTATQVVSTATTGASRTAVASAGTASATGTPSVTVTRVPATATAPQVSVRGVEATATRVLSPTPSLVPTAVPTLVVRTATPIPPTVTKVPPTATLGSDPATPSASAP